jgi:hypothetical protein
LACRVELLPDQEQREANRHADHDVKGGVDRAGGGVVRLADA